MKCEEGYIYYTKIIVIQSIPDDERQTGTELHDDTISRRTWLDPTVITEVIDVSSRDEFLKLIDRIKKDTQNKEICNYSL